MITGRIFDSVIVAVLLAILANGATIKSRNLIYSQPGVVAVYVRRGDTPLQEINEDLAEAFSFNALKHGRQAFGRQINEILNEKEKNPNLLNSAELAEGESYTPKKKPIGKKTQGAEKDSHIQKIPRQ